MTLGGADERKAEVAAIVEHRTATAPSSGQLDALPSQVAYVALLRADERALESARWRAPVRRSRTCRSMSVKS